MKSGRGLPETVWGAEIGPAAARRRALKSHSRATERGIEGRVQFPLRAPTSTGCGADLGETLKNNLRVGGYKGSVLRRLQVENLKTASYFAGLGGYGHW